MSSYADQLKRFRSDALLHVDGWLGHRIVDVLELACQYHTQHRIKGDALEIGVYQGLFFLALMAALEVDEVAVAADIFDDQSLNIDKSGAGTEILAAFNRNVSQFAHNPDALRLLIGDSMVLRGEQILERSAGSRFRFVSVDGGHTAEHVMNDLNLASYVIAGGGVVFLDDFHSPHWPGVHEGYVRYMLHANRNLAPVLFADNKLMLTTISHQPHMVEYMREHYVPSEGRYMADVSSLGFRYLASS